MRTCLKNLEKETIHIIICKKCGCIKLFAESYTGDRELCDFCEEKTTKQML